ncbi:MAG: ribonuclease D [Paracoccaceae bacterium]|jgi:ribonuclease D
MNIISDTAALAAFCAECAKHPYVTVDTEFLRERTYWPQLCLVQIAHPIEGDLSAERGAAIIDPLAEGIDLTPMMDLMADPSVIKVFHAARQDIEIFWKMSGRIPAPFFDTQVAAMVCGYGDQVGYETLVRKIAAKKLDKSSRFTDWARRPLSEKQLAYAIADVTHLRKIYESLDRRLVKSGRGGWVTEELSSLTSEDTYRNDPETAWKRVKTRSSDGRFLAVVKALAKWREARAQEKDIPRSRLMKDDALLEIASNRPKDVEELGRSRLLLREARRGEAADGILAAVAEGEIAPEVIPDPRNEAGPSKPGAGALTDLLKVLLKARADEIGVAQKLLASSDDLTVIAIDDIPDVPAMKGWRREAFGNLALQLKNGEIALSANARGIDIIEFED